MLIATSLILIILSFMPLSLLAQNMPYQAQQTMQKTIKGTLDGLPPVQQFKNHTRQLVFPNSVNSGINVNPWSNQPSPNAIQAPNYSGQPMGNPWAPIGSSQNIPFDASNITGIEKNPYTDNNSVLQGVPMSRGAPSRYSYPSSPNQYSPFNNGYNNQFYDGSNGSFNTPFGNNFFPGNQFWPNGNNMNGSFPFMPW